MCEDSMFAGLKLFPLCTHYIFCVLLWFLFRKEKEQPSLTSWERSRQRSSRNGRKKRLLNVMHQLHLTSIRSEFILKCKVKCACLNSAILSIIINMDYIFTVRTNTSLPFPTHTWMESFILVTPSVSPSVRSVSFC